MNLIEAGRFNFPRPLEQSPYNPRGEVSSFAAKGLRMLLCVGVATGAGLAASYLISGGTPLEGVLRQATTHRDASQIAATLAFVGIPVGAFVASGLSKRG